MKFSFNDAFFVNHETDKKNAEQADKCNSCEHLKEVVDNHHWCKKCELDKCVK